MLGAHSPRGVGGGDLRLIRLGSSDRDGIYVGTADQSLGIAQVHGVFHRCGHLRGGVRGHLAPHEVLQQGGTKPVQEGLLQIGHAGLFVDVGAEVGIGAEEVEGAMNAVFDRADAQPPLVVTCPDRVLRLEALEHLVYLFFGELHYSVGVLVVDAHPDEELLGGIPNRIGEFVISVDDSLAIPLYFVFFDYILHYGNEALDDVFVLVPIKGPVQGLPKDLPHAKI